MAGVPVGGGSVTPGMRALRDHLHAQLLQGRAVRVPFRQRCQVRIPGEAQRWESAALVVYALPLAGDALVEIGAITMDPHTWEVTVTFGMPQSGVLYLVPVAGQDHPGTAMEEGGT